MEIDCGTGIKALQLIVNENQKFTDIERAALLYAVVYLLKNDEYSVRQYTLLAFEFLIKDASDSLLNVVEYHIVKRLMPKIKDELTF